MHLTSQFSAMGGEFFLYLGQFVGCDATEKSNEKGAPSDTASQTPRGAPMIAALIIAAITFDLIFSISSLAPPSGTWYGSCM